MKCLLITSYFPPTIGGSAKVYGNIFKYGRGQVAVLTTSNRNDGDVDDGWKEPGGIYRLKHLMAPSVRCRNILHTAWVVLRYDLPVQVTAILSALRLIKRLEIDVVCIGELHELGWMGAWLGKLTHVKVIFYIHGEELTTQTSSRFYGKNAKKYLERADGIVSVSLFTKNTITSLYDIDKDKIRLISNGIDLDECRPAAMTNFSQKYKRQHQAALIFSIGRLIERKGFDIAVDAMGIVHASHPAARLVIAGEGEMKGELEARIKENKLGDVVTMAGRLSHDELVGFYEGCDIFLMPNRELENGDTEGFGLVFLEANAFRKPVIGGNAGGAVDAIVNGKTGFLVDGNSAEDVAGAIIKLLDDESLRTEMGENGFHWAMKNDVRNKVNEFLAYCEELVSAR